MRGVNIDPRNPTSIITDYSTVKPLHSVRYVFDVSMERGSTNLADAYALYDPILSGFAECGIVQIIVLNHETWGEGRGFNWEHMDLSMWQSYAEGLSKMAARIAQHVYWELGVSPSQIVWQIGNEHDALPGTFTSVPMPAQAYAYLLDAVAGALRGVSSVARIISHGHCRSPQEIVKYWSDVKRTSALAKTIEGVGYHPYTYSGNTISKRWGWSGTIATAVNKVLGVLDEKQEVWLTEFGPQDENATPTEVAPFIADFFAGSEAIFRVSHIVYFAWGKQDRNTAVVDASGKKRAKIWDAMTSGIGSLPLPAAGRSGVTSDNLNYRRTPTTKGIRVGTLPKGTPIVLETVTVSSDGFNWARIVSCPSAKLAEGKYVADKFVEFESPNEVPPNPPKPSPLPKPEPNPKPISRKAWTGLHVVGNPPSGFYNMLSRLHHAGKPVPFILTVANGIAASIKAASPQTIVAVRTYPDEPRTPQGVLRDGADYFNEKWAALSADRGIADYFVFTNEWFTNGPNTPERVSYVEQVCNFFLDIMKCAEKEGVKVSIMDLAVGNMCDEREVDKSNDLAILHPAFRHAEEHGHALNYHMYADANDIYNLRSNADWYAMRWVNWLKRYPGLRVFGGESGFYDAGAVYKSPEHTIGMMRDLDGLIHEAISRGEIRPEQIIGHAWWTLGDNYVWSKHNFESALSDYEKYILDV